MTNGVAEGVALLDGVEIAADQLLAFEGFELAQLDPANVTAGVAHGAFVPKGCGLQIQLNQFARVSRAGMDMGFANDAQLMGEHVAVGVSVEGFTQAGVVAHSSRG